VPDESSVMIGSGVAAVHVTADVTDMLAAASGVWTFAAVIELYAERSMRRLRTLSPSDFQRKVTRIDGLSRVA